MSHIVGIIQARTNSSRLPGKVLKSVLGKPMIVRQIERLKRCSQLDTLVVATTDSPSDDQLAAVVEREGIPVFRGSVDDVLDRMYRAACSVHATDVVRLTADCPLTDAELIDKLVLFYRRGRYDYASNTVEPSFPDGLDAEILSFSALERCWREARSSGEREHVTQYIRAQKGGFVIGSLKGEEDLSGLRWTVDEPEDYELVKTIYEALYPRNKDFKTTEIVECMRTLPGLGQMNEGIMRDEGLKKSRFNDRYAASTRYHREALEVIPLGSQTFSKSKTQFPVGAAPLCIESSKGARVWDIDGNEFLDLGSSLGAINLGYGDAEVDAAVRAQLERGVIFPLPASLELEVARQLVEMVPCAEMVRFGKNGSDATTGAVRLARAFTERDEVVTIGYHGWHDWYIGTTTKGRGVPRRTAEMTHRLPYNDLSAIAQLFEERGSRLAALIMEPMNRECPREGYLQGVQELCRQHGVILIFDEMVTGFRYAAGGAQQLFGVTPDLATFGKGIANGYPLSALVGRREIMSLLDDIFFSFTFGGEALSLAAASAVLTKIRNQPVIERIHERGTALIQGIQEIIKRYRLEGILAVTGHPAWSFIEFQDHSVASQWEIRTLFLQEMFYRGVLTIASNMPSYAHSEGDINFALQVHDEVCELISQGVSKGNLRRHLVVKPLQPLFKVR